MGALLQKLKSSARDFLPAKLQVPAKYWFSRFNGTAEPEMAMLPSLVRAGDRVIDIGGNRGIYAYRLAKLGARIEVFEPNPTCLAVLHPWAASVPGVTIHATALSSHSGEATLHIPRDASGVEHDSSASIEHVVPGEIRDEIVALRTLDSFDFTEISLIKIDVEGHEYDVIEGASGTISRSLPVLLVEIEQRHSSRPIHDVFARVLRFGYDGFFLLHGRLEPIDRFDVAEHQSPDNFEAGSGYYYNFLFLPREKLSSNYYPALQDRWMRG